MLPRHLGAAGGTGTAARCLPCSTRLKPRAQACSGRHLLLLDGGAGVCPVRPAAGLRMPKSGRSGVPVQGFLLGAWGSRAGAQALPEPAGVGARLRQRCWAGTQRLWASGSREGNVASLEPGETSPQTTCACAPSPPAGKWQAQGPGPPAAEPHRGPGPSLANTSGGCGRLSRQLGASQLRAHSHALCRQGSRAERQQGCVLCSRRPGLLHLCGHRPGPAVARGCVPPGSASVFLGPHFLHLLLPARAPGAGFGVHSNWG